MADLPDDTGPAYNYNNVMDKERNDNLPPDTVPNTPTGDAEKSADDPDYKKTKSTKKPDNNPTDSNLIGGETRSGSTPAQGSEANTDQVDDFGDSLVPQV